MTRISFKDGHRALAVAMVCHAVKDMRDTGVQSTTQLRYGRSKTELRIGATVWLASKAAMWWFDNIGVEQRNGVGVGLSIVKRSAGFAQPKPY